jgi:GNAT superfamily N-acetyltransferase
LVEDEAKGPIGVLYGLDVVEGSRRRGLGSFLVKEVLDLLRKAKVRLVWIQASSGLGTPEEVLIAFYEGLGFKLCCRTEDAANDPALSLELRKEKPKN